MQAVGHNQLVNAILCMNELNAKIDAVWNVSLVLNNLWLTFVRLDQKTKHAR